MGSELNEPWQTYGRLWNEAVSAFERSDLEFDRHLPNKDQDLRHGLSLAFRPSEMVQASISKLVLVLSYTLVKAGLEKSDPFSSGFAGNKMIGVTP